MLVELGLTESDPVDRVVVTRPGALTENPTVPLQLLVEVTVIGVVTVVPGRAVMIELPVIE